MSDKLIDAEQAAHYYSSMNFRALILVCCLLSLSACVSNKSVSDAVVISKPSDSPVPVDPTLETANVDIDNSTDTENAEQETVSQALGEVGPALPPDLIQRIRNGFELPDLQSEHIQQYERWSSQHESYLRNLFTRATPFLYHIVEEIDARGLPMELALLPAVESAYRPTAVSRSNAGGLWQFVPSTGRYFGLRQDWWYDGRRDALASTKAALDYLTKLNKMFDGDWFLALAAYNAGPGTVSRAIKANKSRGRGTRYQDLKLRSETRRYVPKLLALKNIIESPEKFDVELPRIESRPYFQIVKLDGQVDLNVFAKDADIDASVLRNLNAGFKRWATAPEGPHRLLIPLNSDGNVQHAELAAQRAPKLDYRNHTIQQGDSLSRIARRYGVSVKAIQSSNNMNNTRIRAGRSLLIPVRGDAPISAPPAADSKAKNKVFHKVRSGDTLWSIARRYKVQLENLLSWNNISATQVLRLNQQLMVLTN